MTTDPTPSPFPADVQRDLDQRGAPRPGDNLFPADVLADLRRVNIPARPVEFATDDDPTEYRRVRFTDYTEADD